MTALAAGNAVSRRLSWPHALGLLLLGGAGAWVWSAHPFSGAAVADRMSALVLLDRSFTRTELDDALAEPGISPQAAGVLSLKRFEMELAANAESPAVETWRRRADAAVVDALAASPQQGYFWFALFALRWSGQESELATHVPLLDMSYRLAPFEGWVAMRRTLIAMPIADHLPAAVRDSARAEFFGLVAKGIEQPIGRVFWQVTPGVRSEILERITGLPKLQRDRAMRQIARDMQRGMTQGSTVP
jgi:hypothetical protein